MSAVGDDLIYGALKRDEGVGRGSVRSRGLSDLHLLQCPAHRSSNSISHQLLRKSISFPNTTSVPDKIPAMFAGAVHAWVAQDIFTAKAQRARSGIFLNSTFCALPVFGVSLPSFQKNKKVCEPTRMARAGIPIQNAFFNRPLRALRGEMSFFKFEFACDKEG
jgi:hypothetical protein